MTPRTEAIKDISKGRVVVVAAGSGAEADQPSWRREVWTGGLNNIHNPWAAGLREEPELELCQGSRATQATRITLATLLCLPSVKGLIWILAATGWWLGAGA